MNKMRNLALTAIIAVVATLGLVAVTQGEGQPDKAPPAPGLHKQFGLINKVPATPAGDRRAGELAAYARSEGETAPGLAVRAQRRGNAELYAAVGDRNACMLIRPGNATTAYICSPGADMLADQSKQPISTSLYDDNGRVQVSGMLIDGIDRVSVESRSGKTTEVPVVNNVWTVLLDEAPASVTWVGTDGVEHRTVTRG